MIAGDGQVSLGPTIIKANARKVRALGSRGGVIAGFAGSTADAFTLFERLEAKLEQYPGQLTRAAVELAKDWRTDRFLRRLEAMMIVADKDVTLVLTGTGDVLEPENYVMGIGSGGMYALAAARALLDQPLDAETIARKAMAIAGRDLRPIRTEISSSKAWTRPSSASRRTSNLCSRECPVGWIYLVLAGVIEVGMTTAMRYSEGFTKLWPTATTIGLAVVSFLLVARASETVPLGTAYAAWGAFGVIGTGASRHSLLRRARKTSGVSSFLRRF